jgi:hypothetical protein
MPNYTGGLHGCVFLEAREKKQRLDIDPELVTQYKDENNKQVKVYNQPNENIEHVPIDKTAKRKKRKKKYLPGERLIQELMGSKPDKQQQDKNKMDKITNTKNYTYDVSTIMLSKTVAVFFLFWACF